MCDAAFLAMSVMRTLYQYFQPMFIAAWAECAVRFAPTRTDVIRASLSRPNATSVARAIRAPKSLPTTIGCSMDVCFTALSFP